MPLDAVLYVVPVWSRYVAVAGDKRLSNVDSQASGHGLAAREPAHDVDAQVILRMMEWSQSELAVATLNRLASASADLVELAQESDDVGDNEGSERHKPHRVSLEVEKPEKAPPSETLDTYSHVMPLDELTEEQWNSLLMP